MDYRKIGETYYVRMDRGDEIVSNLLEICEKENNESAARDKCVEMLNENC